MNPNHRRVLGSMDESLQQNDISKSVLLSMGFCGGVPGHKRRQETGSPLAIQWAKLNDEK